MPRLDRVIETAIYVDDLVRAASFYEQIMELPLMVCDARFRAYDIGGESVFLVFKRGATLDTVHLPGGTIPPHDGHGPLHMAFGVAADELGDWERRLTEKGVAIEARTAWPRGGHSIYFRDPDNHLLELVTRGVWKIYCRPLGASFRVASVASEPGIQTFLGSEQIRSRFRVRALRAPE